MAAIALKHGNATSVVVPQESHKAAATFRDYVEPVLFAGNYYLVIEFERPRSARERAALHVQGVALLQYLPANL